MGRIKQKRQKNKLNTHTEEKNLEERKERKRNS